MKNNIVVLLLALTLGACSLGPEKKDAAATYDLGALPVVVSGQPRIRASLLVHAVAAPSWLESNSIVYRLNYQDSARQLAYANSRWAAPAAALLTQRLRAQLAASSDGGILGIADSARADYALRVELEEFSQVFDSTTASRAVIVARASIVNVARRTLHAQKTFTVDKPAPGANAEGGVRALSSASGELIDAVVAWTAASLAQDRK
jgi:cholesterol transport system auxiliary component